jgi:hypothetical protein
MTDILCPNRGCDRRNRCEYYQNYRDWHRSPTVLFDVEWIKVEPKRCTIFKETE